MTVIWKESELHPTQHLAANSCNIFLAFFYFYSPVFNKNFVIFTYFTSVSVSSGVQWLSDLIYRCTRVHDNEFTKLHNNVHEYGGNGEIGCSAIKN